MTRVATILTRTGIRAFAALHVAVLVAPAAMLALAANKGGMPAAHGWDLVAASTAVGLVHGRTVARRLRRELRRSARPLDAWIAAGNGLIVLAAFATALFFLLLGGYAPELAAAVNKGWHVLVAWTILQLVAVAVAEATHRELFRWLRPATPPDGSDPARGTGSEFA